MAWEPLKPAFALMVKSGGGGGIRTLDTGLPYTRFPGVLLRPLGHPSAGAAHYAIDACRRLVICSLEAVSGGRCVFNDIVLAL